MIGFVDFFIVSVDELELEILNDIRSKEKEIISNTIVEALYINDLIKIKEMYKNQNLDFEEIN